MVLKSIELSGFKSFAKKTTLFFDAPVTGIVGPNGSGKSNVVEAIRFVLGEQSIKSLRGKGGTDLIFKGSKTLAPLSRASVTITFDNRNKLFTFADSSDTKAKMLSYDEVRITRTVYSDGSNSYLINDTEVRLKDIVELLSSVNIGSSGHHIISQGEADRILSANARDRRFMIEDALGLKIYQYRIKETERRLLKTEANMKEVGALKRELAPHLVYLKKQVEKIQKAESLRNDLISLYRVYCGKEEKAIAQLKKDCSVKKSALLEEYREMSEVFARFEKEKNGPFTSLFEKEYLHVIHTLSELGRLKNELERSLGRLEGAQEALMHKPESEKSHTEKLIPFSFLESTFSEIKNTFSVLYSSTDISFIHQTIKNVEIHLTDALNRARGEVPKVIEQHDTTEQINSIKYEIETLSKQLFEVEAEQKNLEVQKVEFEKKMEQERDAKRQQEQGYYEMASKKASLEMQIKNFEREESLIASREELFHNELREGVALLGLDMPRDFHEIDTHGGNSEETQEELKRKLERVKIKLEESGGLGGSDTLKEYDTTVDRDRFLTQELSDLENSIQELRLMIADLKVKLDTDFKEGIEKINNSFQNFFSLMFGGGGAYLAISVEHKRRKKDDDEDTEIPDVTLSSDEEMEFERGIDIHVSLPQKKVKELSMLSGGERSLTSIALLFAMSQVNPPPFLVLDETDAALDEANSRRYGDMIESLSRFSQLAVVTHNRETMSRASVLYGVTVGSDGGSKLLSIKFDDATAYAK